MMQDLLGRVSTKGNWPKINAAYKCVCKKLDNFKAAGALGSNYYTATVVGGVQ